MTGKWWLNDENDLFWQTTAGGRHWVNSVESFTIRFGGGMARALLVVRMPNIAVIEEFQSGDGFTVVHNLCRRRGDVNYADEDVRLVLSRCAVLDKGLDSLFTNDPREVATIGAWMKVRGILRLYPNVNE